MAHLKTQDDLKKEIAEVGKQVKVGGRYSHYKKPENIYQVIGLGVQESTDKICVLYKPEYMDDITFVRDLDSWLAMPELEGKLVERFTLLPDDKEM